MHFFEEAINNGNNIVEYDYEIRPGTWYHYEVNVWENTQTNTVTATVRRLMRVLPL